LKNQQSLLAPSPEQRLTIAGLGAEADLSKTKQAVVYDYGVIALDGTFELT
jgi:hypothetical protein